MLCMLIMQFVLECLTIIEAFLINSYELMGSNDNFFADFNLERGLMSILYETQ